MTCWVDNHNGRPVPEPSQVYLSVPENELTRGRVRALIDALNAAQAQLDDEATPSAAP